MWCFSIPGRRQASLGAETPFRPRLTGGDKVDAAMGSNSVQDIRTTGDCPKATDAGLAGSASGPVRTRSDRAGSLTATEHRRRRPRTDRACRLPGRSAAGSLRNISRLYADPGVEVVVLGAANHVDVVHCIRVDGSAGSDHDIFMEDCPRGLAGGGSMRDDRPCPDPRFAPVDFEVSSLAESMSSCQAGPAGTEEGQAGSGRTGIIDAPTGDVLSRDFDRGAWMS